MVNKLAMLTVAVLTSFAVAQNSARSVEISTSVDTSGSEISQVIQLWKNYLNSNPDSTYFNPYWVASEQRQYSPYDLVAHTWWGASQYRFLSYPRWRLQVLSVSRIADSFIIRSMFYTILPEDSGEVSIASIFRTAARIEDGSYKLCNVLPIFTRHWTKEQVGSIKFVFPPDHRFNRKLAEQASRFVDSLAALWNIPVVPIDYYFADDIDRVAKALGFDYWPAEGNISGPRGFTDIKNHIVYSGGSNEWYPHEFVHIYINPLFPNAYHYFLEGYATLLGGSQGHSLSWHIRRNWDYLKNHPEVNVLTFKGVDPFVPAQYFIGGLLCKIAEQKGGLPMIRKLMTYGKEDQDLYRAIHDVLGVSKDHINDFLRRAMAEEARN